MTLKILDLFSGIGGFSLGLENTGGFETAAFCEIDPYARAVLQKHWPGVPIFEDIRELKADAIGPVHIICGGYPCQPFSQAGKRGGEKDDRHLWPEMYRLVASIRPRWVIAENVAGHISMGLDQVLSDLEGEGYTCWPLVIPACAVGAPHRRDRVWIVADADSTGRKEQRGAEPDGEEHEAPERGGGWLPEPNVGRVAHGVPSRVDRLKALGNAVVPQVVEQIGWAILEAEKA